MKHINNQIEHFPFQYLYWLKKKVYGIKFHYLNNATIIKLAKKDMIIR